MKVNFANHVLVAAGIEGVKGLSVNGEQQIEEADFFRAAAAVFYGRGNEKSEISFSVARDHGSVKLADLYALTRRKNLPREGDLVITCGFPGDEQVIFFPNAVLGPSNIRLIGQTSITAYVFMAGLPDTDTIPDEGEVDPDVTRRSTVAIANAATSGSVAFLNAMSGAPTVTCSVVCPSGGDAIFATIVDGSVTATGFNYVLSGPTPSADYKLAYIAIL